MTYISAKNVKSLQVITNFCNFASLLNNLQKLQINFSNHFSLVFMINVYVFYITIVFAIHIKRILTRIYSKVHFSYVQIVLSIRLMIDY